MDTKVEINEFETLEQEMADFSKGILEIQRRYEESKGMYEIAQRSKVSLLDEDGAMYDFKELIGEESYRTISAMVQIAIKGIMKECKEKFDIMRGMAAVEPGKPEEKEEPQEKPKKKRTKKKDEIDVGKIISLHNAGWMQIKIADEMGCSQGTVGSILRKAREHGED